MVNINASHNELCDLPCFLLNQISLKYLIYSQLEMLCFASPSNKFHQILWILNGINRKFWPSGKGYWLYLGCGKCSLEAFSKAYLFQIFS